MYGKVAEFYLGYFKGSRFYNPSLILVSTETQPAYYSVEAPGVGYYKNGTILANDRVTVNLSRSVIVSSYNDQNKGIYLKTSSDKVTVIGQSASTWGYLYRKLARNLDTFIVNEITDLSISEYEYFAVSVNGSGYYYNSSVLIVGTRNNTLLKLTVTQPVTTRVGNIIISLIPGKEYSFGINRLQTLFLSSLNDLTGTRIVTNKPVSVFSGHEYTVIPWNTYPYAYLIEQMPPTTLWSNTHYVIPLASHQSGYAVKVLAARDCVVNIYCNDYNYMNTSLKTGKHVFKMLLNNETCAIQSSSKILVIQFSLKYDNYRYGGPMMTLVPSTLHYLSKITFSTTVYEYTKQDWINYINIIVLAQYFHPEEIYLKTGGMNKSLDTQEWVPIKVNNVTLAYGTTVNNVSMGIIEVIHSNKAALMSVILYGFTRGGAYGTTANVLSSEIGK